MIGKRKEATISRSRPPSPSGGLWNTTVVGENVFLPLALPSLESRLIHHGRNQGKPRIFVAHGCMLIPVAVGIWWFYFRRKTSSVFRKLLVKNRPEEQQQTASRPRGAYEEDEFSTWYVAFPVATLVYYPCFLTRNTRPSACYQGGSKQSQHRGPVG